MIKPGDIHRESPRLGNGTARAQNFPVPDNNGDQYPETPPTPPAFCSPGNSFVPGTKVLMADGTTKPIEDVKIGDWVIAADTQTGLTAARRVSHLITGDGEKHLVRITITSDEATGKSGTVVATDGHPFWVPDLRKWVTAGDLLPGTLLRTSAGTYVQLTAVKKWTAPQRVHNLTVEGLHTHHVLAGDQAVLVHNGNCPLSAAELARDKAGVNPDGTPNRQSPVYVGGYDANGNIIGTGNGPRGSGVHAEDIIQERMPGVQMTEPYAWRRNKVSGELEWRPHTVCLRCQGNYPPSLFPPGTRGESGGVWGD